MEFRLKITAAARGQPASTSLNLTDQSKERNDPSYVSRDVVI
jgi:hypothetical protein